MFQDFDQDLLANIFSFLPSGDRGKAAHNLMNSSKVFYELFHQENSEVSQFNEYFREVFSSMYIPTIYCQIYLKQDMEMSEVIESMKLIPDKCEILSESEFVVELDYSDPLLDGISHHFPKRSIKEVLQNWKLDCGNSTLTEENMKSYENKTKIEVNIFRIFQKFKLHFMHRPRINEPRDDTCTTVVLFNTITVNYPHDYPIYKDLLQQVIYKIFVRHTRLYGVFELNQVYNDKEMSKLSKILSRGSSIELIDYFTIQKNLIHYFTNSFLSNNTQFIKYTKHATEIHKNGVGIIENLSIIPWNVLSNNSRTLLASLFIKHVFKEEMNISDEFCSIYRQSQNETVDSNGNELKYFTHDDHIDIRFLTLQIRRTKSIIRNNIISIPSYPNVTMQNLSHTIPRNDMLIIANESVKFDKFNTWCMKYCTFNTISAPLWLVPCWCWWGMIYSCICWTGPLCFKAPPNTSWTSIFSSCGDISAFMCDRGVTGICSMESKLMPCLDPEICFFVSLNGMCYPCCLPYRHIGPTEPRYENWKTIDNIWR